MLSVKNNYATPNLLKKIRIRAIEQNERENFSKVLQNSFYSFESEQASNIQISNHSNPVIGLLQA
jgi:hypothetical protein